MKAGHDSSLEELNRQIISNIRTHRESSNFVQFYNKVQKGDEFVRDSHEKMEDKRIGNVILRYVLEIYRQVDENFPKSFDKSVVYLLDANSKSALKQIERTDDYGGAVNYRENAINFLKEQGLEKPVLQAIQKIHEIFKKNYDGLQIVYPIDLLAMDVCDLPKSIKVPTYTIEFEGIEYPVLKVVDDEISDLDEILINKVSDIFEGNRRQSEEALDNICRKLKLSIENYRTLTNQTLEEIGNKIVYLENETASLRKEDEFSPVVEEIAKGIKKRREWFTECYTLPEELFNALSVALRKVNLSSDELKEIDPYCIKRLTGLRDDKEVYDALKYLGNSREEFYKRDIADLEKDIELAKTKNYVSSKEFDDSPDIHPLRRALDRIDSVREEKKLLVEKKGREIYELEKRKNGLLNNFEKVEKLVDKSKIIS